MNVPDIRFCAYSVCRLWACARVHVLHIHTMNTSSSRRSCMCDDCVFLRASAILSSVSFFWLSRDSVAGNLIPLWICLWITNMTLHAVMKPCSAICFPIEMASADSGVEHRVWAKRGHYLFDCYCNYVLNAFVLFRLRIQMTSFRRTNEQPFTTHQPICN